jgi:tetratricopeptide (TPR) repeat protein
MLVRLTQSAAADGVLRVAVSVDGEGLPPARVEAEVPFSVEPTDIERLRWYLEDFLEYPLDPAPELARGVEQRLVEVGTGLFRAVFQSSDDARDLWAMVRNRLGNARIEIVSDVTGAAALPWELLRDPATNVAVALRARTFVRAHHNPAQRMEPHPADQPSLRVLLVICRPQGSADVPFRSVAGHLAGLAHNHRSLLRLDVLRPPTFDKLARVLRAATDAGDPYRVVHFDGHGTYLDSAQLNGGSNAGAGNGSGNGGRSQLRASMLSPLRPGSHGYLLFEDPAAADNMQFVDGPRLGALLAETGVPVLLLNACRSAHAEAPTEPQPGDAAVADVHSRVRAYGSLAQEVADAGVPGVVAMRYNVWVVTAAQFVAGLYESLLNGQPLGEAVTAGRKHLAEQPGRAVAFEPVPLQDWMVPVVYEAARLTLFTRPATRLTLSADRPVPGERLVALPDRPDVGFIGRDETLLALDRVFDSQPIVLLYAFAGSGKTSTAAEFGRWYAETGGLFAGDGATQGVVLFSSFEHQLPLPRLLDMVGETFQALLAASGIEWLTLTEDKRRDVTMQILSQVPVLWVWDNVEPVAGFPAGTPSAWSPAEQQELANFLRDVRSTKARVLLTSRRDEHGWLGDLPARVQLPAMPMREQVQLAAKIVERYPPHRITDVADWRPLLRYTAGNPLTVTVLVGQAIRQGLTTRGQIEGFVDRLHAGEGGVVGDEQQGRSRSLAASLSYGLSEAFTDTDRARLAVLHLFHDQVDVDALVLMGGVRGPASDDGDATNNPLLVPELAGLARDDGIALLDKAAEIGLLTARGGGYYAVHPALPWYFSRLFIQHHGPPDSPRAQAAARAYTNALSDIGDYYHRQIESGRHQFVRRVAAEEANLLHARTLARINGWWDLVTGPMQGLDVLYGFTGRRADWARLVDELTPDLTDAATDQSVPGRDHQWSLLTGYRSRLALRTRNWPLAEHLQSLTLDWHRLQADDDLTRSPGELDDMARFRIRNLAVSLQQLGGLLRDQGRADCVDVYQESAELLRRIGARREEATTAFNLGHAYIDVTEVCDLDRAENAYRYSLELRDADDQLGRARCVGELGRVAFQRFKNARLAGEADLIQLAHLDTALRHYHEELDLLLADAITDLDVTHGQLGVVYARRADFDSDLLDTAIGHYRRSVEYATADGNPYSAGQSRYNAALLLARHRRPSEAQAWANAALRDFDTVGAGAQQDAAQTRELLAHIDSTQADQQSDAT